MKRFLSCLLIIASVAGIGIAVRYGTDKETVAPITLTLGHVGHDHHLALFVAADHAERFAEQTGIRLKPLQDKKHYALLDGERKLADVRIVKVGGGSKMPTALAREIIDLGFGGTAAVLAAADRGAPVKLLAPAHARGDLFVLRPGFPADDWEEFVAYTKANDTPVRIGYKAPIAVAKLIFEDALQHEGLSFSGNPGDANADVLMRNCKGGGKLNAALAGGLVDGYAGNNPFPAIGAERGMLKVVAELETLPPGNFRDHPCCCVAAHTQALKGKSEAITALLALLVLATDTINSDLDTAVASATRWIGTTETVERNSIPTSTYDMRPSVDWHAQMTTWLDAMQGLGAFTGSLKGATEPQAAALCYDLSPLSAALKRIGRQR